MNKNKRPGRKSEAAELTPKQEAAILALLESPTLEGAARIGGVSRGSLWAWMKAEPFKGKLTAARGELFRENIAGLKATLSGATAKLAALLSSKDEGVRRLAASTLWSLSLKANETLDIEERLLRLERIAEENKH